MPISPAREGRPRRIAEASGQGSGGCRAEEERPVASRAEGQTGIGRCSQRALSYDTVIPAHKHIPGTVKNSEWTSLQGNGCGLHPKTLMGFEGLWGVSSYCRKELSTATGAGPPSTGPDFTPHTCKPGFPPPVFPEFFAALKIPRAPV